MKTAAKKPSVLTIADCDVPWDLAIEVPTHSGSVMVPVRHPDAIEPDGVQTRPGGLLFIAWLVWAIVRRIAIGKDTSNRANERRIRSLVMGAFDPQYRDLIEGLGMMRILQIREAIQHAQMRMIRSATEAMQRRMDDERSQSDRADSYPSPAAVAAPSPSRGEGAGGVIRRSNGDGTRSTLFPVVVGKPLPGALGGGDGRPYGMPKAEWERVKQQREKNEMAGKMPAPLEHGAQNKSPERPDIDRGRVPAAGGCEGSQGPALADEPPVAPDQDRGLGCAETTPPSPTGENC